MNFTGFAGNGRIKALLAAQFSGGRLPHCFLLDGPEGSGRRTLARLIAKTAMCLAPREDAPCGACASCVKLDKDIHPDFMEIRGTGASGTFAVEVIRSMREDMFVVPSESDRKTVLLLNTDTMSEQSQNALLTILEEPPSYGLLLLTCKSAAAMLPTIRSRAAALSLSPVSDEDAAAELLRRGVPEEKIPALTRSGNGLIGRMLSLHEDEARGESAEFCAALVPKLLQNDELPLLLHCAALEKNRTLCRESLELLRMIFRDALVAKSGGRDRSFSDPAPAGALAAKLSAPRLLSMLELLDAGETMLRRNIHGALYATWLPAALREAAGF